jgi:predicted GH43/DUF377 family glycosyl hydrolase
LGITTSINGLHDVLLGQDPRFLKLSEDKIFIAYTNRFSSPLRMGYSEIFINSTGYAELRNVHHTIHVSNPQETRHPQKNWSPFIYNETILYVQRINPLTIVSTKEDAETSNTYAYDFSTTSHRNLNWKYGEIRGGTNALLVNKDTYLSFFHSSINLPQNYFKTYFMGAYTFTASPPFKLIAMSPYPIIDERLYTGPWDGLKNRKIDYCVFPMSFYLDDNDIIVLSFGHNDRDGYIAKIHLTALLKSLEPIVDDE